VDVSGELVGAVAAITPTGRRASMHYVVRAGGSEAAGDAWHLCCGPAVGRTGRPGGPHLGFMSPTG
jgi:hypothetical protein